MRISSFPQSRCERYFEDYIPGYTYICGTATFNESEIVEFARRFDPQEIHLNPNAAARGPFGSVIASGWHTAGAVMRLYVEHFLSAVATTPSPGVDELKWRKPVKPGDTLSVRVTIVEAVPSRSKPDRGIVKSLVEAFNQQGEIAMSLRTTDIILKRQPSPQ